MNRIDSKFKELRAAGKKAFMPFLTAGYPSLPMTGKLILEFEKRGADVIELGIPFSDPIADGPVIQQSSYEAIKNGTTLKKVFGLVRRLREETQIPLAAMTYFNLILNYGPTRFIKDALAAGFDGVIIPDLPPEEEGEFSKEARKKGLKVILFMAPTTSRERAGFIARRAEGFIYFVSLTGVTGARRELPRELGFQLRAAKKAAGDIAVCAGFGVSTPQQVKAISAFCDGVIVGSAIVKKISESIDASDPVKAVGDFMARLKG
ncbi:MAG TPA: tryptophan synthase subunit alpha [Candidatus Omnitrophica bacterium]|nr:tryptophan synthase subunit alpha [Candidatus Omnitrophota bacterium]